MTPPSVLFITAHPDDAELAAGGTISSIVQRGIPVSVYVLTTSEDTTDRQILRREMAVRAAARLGHNLIWLEEGRYCQVEEIGRARLVAAIDDIVRRLSPTCVFSHWEGDSHWDHVITASCVRASSRLWDADLYAMPPNELRTPAFGAFAPNTFVDITDHIDAKVDAIKEFASGGNLFRPVSSDAFRTVNLSYGVVSGTLYAEAFLLLRQRQLRL